MKHLTHEPIRKLKKINQNKRKLKTQKKKRGTSDLHKVALCIVLGRLKFLWDVEFEKKSED